VSRANVCWVRGRGISISSHLGSPDLGPPTPPHIVRWGWVTWNVLVGYNTEDLSRLQLNVWRVPIGLHQLRIYGTRGYIPHSSLRALC
jgi:hypothetical protein